MSTVDKAYIRESLPAKDRRPNHWATSPTMHYTLTLNSAKLYCLCASGLPKTYLTVQWVRF